MGLTPEKIDFLERHLAVKLDHVHARAVLEARRQASVTGLSGIVISTDLLAEKRRGFADQRKDLIAEAKIAPDAVTCDGIDTRGVELTESIARQLAIATARKAAEAAMDTAGKRAAEVAAGLDRGALLFVNETLASIRTKAGGAHDASGFEAVKADCDSFMGMAADAAAYGAYFDSWFKSSAALIASLAGEIADVEDTWDKRNDAVADAAAESRKGDFAAAEVALKTFVVTTTSGTADPDHTAGFIRKVEALEASHGAALDKILASNLRGVNSKKKAIADIRKKGLKDNDVATAEGMIAPLEAWIDGNLPLAEKLGRFHSSANKITEYRTALAAMESERTNSNWSAAEAALDTLIADPVVGSIAASISADKLLKARYEALLARTTKGANKGLRKAWQAHHNAATASPHDATVMKTTLAELENWLLMEEIFDRRAKLMAGTKNWKSIKDYNYTEEVNARFNAKNFSGAIAELNALEPDIRKLSEYLEARTGAEQLRDALPAEPPELRQQVTDALASTDVTARERRPQDALDGLNAVLLDGELRAHALAFADYLAQLARTTAEHKATLDFIVLQSVRDLLDKSLAAAKTLAETDKKPDEAFNALITHSALLKTAKGYGTRRFEAGYTLESLQRAVQQGKDEAPPWEGQIFTGGQSLAGLQDAFKAGDDLVKKGKFDEAQAAYIKIVADCTAAMKKTTLLYEAADKEESNAGHSIESHGMLVSETAHIKRLTTGEAPGNRTSKTGCSSSFHSDSDWLAGREMAANKAMVENDVDVAEKVFKWTGKEPENQGFVIEHGRPIDVAYKGVRPKVSYDSGSDEFKPNGTYETYEILTGLTRAYVNFVWECDKINGKKFRSCAEWAAEYNTVNGAAPTEIEGRWVMMQQFPWAEDWNQAEQRYDKPIK